MNIQSLPSPTVRQRLKLSPLDVKLILWLIVQIKPFKYVGDRTLSQSKKWDLIQQRFEAERTKLADNLVVPTVRTLQRQMAAALRKARNRRVAADYTPFSVFETLRVTLPLADLELAVLELHNLSEAFKNGQMVGLIPPHIKREFDPHQMDVEPGARRRRFLLNASLASFSSYDSDKAEETALILRRMINENRRFHEEMIGLMLQHATAMSSELQRLLDVVEESKLAAELEREEEEEEEEEEGEKDEEMEIEEAKKEPPEQPEQPEQPEPPRSEKRSTLRDVLNQDT